jgi:cellulose biosynthesis protein BcsQ
MAVDLAWRFAARSQHDTLLWDLDSQNGAGYLLGFDDSHHQRAASVFQREGKPLQFVQPTAYPGLSLLPGDESLRTLPAQFARLEKRRLQVLTSFLKNSYQRIVLDCPSGMSDLTEQILHAADLMIVPLPASPLAARAFGQLRSFLARTHHRHPPILPVLSMYDRRRERHREVRNGPAEGWPVVPYAVQLEMTAFNRAPLGTFAEGSQTDRALERLWQAIETKLGTADRNVYNSFSQRKAG